MAKKVTIDDLAVMVKKGFDQTATKEDLKALKEDLTAFKAETNDNFRRVRKDIENLDFKIASAASSWNKDFEKIHSWVMELDERLTAVEAKSAKSK